MKKPEEIRAGNGMTQAQFAEAIGSSRRTYIYRVNGDQPWMLSEVVNIAKLNEGEVLINDGDRWYQIRIEEVQFFIQICRITYIMCNALHSNRQIGQKQTSLESEVFYYMTALMYVFTGLFLIGFTPIVVNEIKLSIETDRELREKGLL